MYKEKTCLLVLDHFDFCQIEDLDISSSKRLHKCKWRRIIGKQS